MPRFATSCHIQVLKASLKYSLVLLVFVLSALSQFVAHSNSGTTNRPHSLPLLRSDGISPTHQQGETIHSRWTAVWQDTRSTRSPLEIEEKEVEDDDKLFSPSKLRTYAHFAGQFAAPPLHPQYFTDSPSSRLLFLQVFRI